MPKCNLSIEFDRPDRLYRAGEKVSGHVLVEVDDECKCHGLSLQLSWATHGRGNTASEDIEALQLFSGTWQPGTYRYPFSAFLPLQGPYTYHGHYLNVDWYASARADIPWALDPKAEDDFLVEPGPNSARDAPEPWSMLEPSDTPVLSEMWQSNKGGVNPRAQMILGSLFLIVGLLFVGLSARDGGSRAFFVLIFPLVGAFLIYSAIKKKIAKQVLGDVETRLEPSRGYPRANCEAGVRFVPPRFGHLNGISVTLRGKERVVSGSGTNRTTYTHIIYEATQVLMQAMDFKANTPVECQQTLDIPHDAAYSFSAPNNDILWEVEYHIDIPRWPDWHHSEPFTVAPAPSTIATEPSPASNSNLSNTQAW